MHRLTPVVITGAISADRCPCCLLAYSRRLPRLFGRLGPSTPRRLQAPVTQSRTPRLMHDLYVLAPSCAQGWSWRTGPTGWSQPSTSQTVSLRRCCADHVSTGPGAAREKPGSHLNADAPQSMCAGRRRYDNEKKATQVHWRSLLIRNIGGIGLPSPQLAASRLRTSRRVSIGAGEVRPRVIVPGLVSWLPPGTLDRPLNKLTTAVACGLTGCRPTTFDAPLP